MQILLLNGTLMVKNSPRMEHGKFQPLHIPTLGTMSVSTTGKKAKFGQSKSWVNFLLVLAYFYVYFSDE